MPHLLQEALPDTLALSACQGLGLDQVAPSHTNAEGSLWVGGVATMTTWVASLSPWRLVGSAPGKAGLATPCGDWQLILQGPSPGQGEPPASPWPRPLCPVGCSFSAPGRVGGGLGVHRLDAVNEKDKSQGVK